MGEVGSEAVEEKPEGKKRRITDTGRGTLSPRRRQGEWNKGRAGHPEGGISRGKTPPSSDLMTLEGGH